jgi:hypothetical protein
MAEKDPQDLGEFSFCTCFGTFLLRNAKKGPWLPSGEVRGILVYFREITKIRAGIRGDVNQWGLYYDT